MGTYRRSDGQERQGFSAGEARHVQDLLFGVMDNTRCALDSIDGEHTKLDALEVELQRVKGQFDEALDIVLAVIRRGEQEANR